MEVRAVRVLAERVLHRGQVVPPQLAVVVVLRQPRGQVVQAELRAVAEQVLHREPREKQLNISEHHHHQ